MDETHGAGAKMVDGAVDGEFDEAFANEPHFGVLVMMGRMGRGGGRESSFVDFEGLAGGQLAFEDAANSYAVGSVDGEVVEGKHGGGHGVVVLGGLRCEEGGKKRGGCGKSGAEFAAGDGHGGSFGKV